MLTYIQFTYFYVPMRPYHPIYLKIYIPKKTIITVCHLIYFFPIGNKQETDKVFKKTKKNESVIATSNNTVQTALERWNAAH